MASPIIFREPSPEEISRRNSSFSCFAGEGILKHFEPIETIPDKHDIRELDVPDAVSQIQSILIGSNFTTKKIGFCYISEEFLGEENIVCSNLRGSYNTHHFPGGCVCYSEELQHLMECCSIQHMINKNMLDITYIIEGFPTEVKIPRTRRPGETQDRYSIGNIIKNSATTYSTKDDTINIYVEFVENSNPWYKTVEIKKFMKANDITTLSLKPKIFSDTFISTQSTKVQNILQHYNNLFRDFVEDKICEKFNKYDIKYSLEYTYFDF